MNKTNVIFILTDDQGYGDLSRHGNPILNTPNMDKLFDESVRFEDFCVSPSCSPSRCALMTGKHEFKSGVTHTILGRNTMSLESKTIANILKDKGYTTGIFGKWHLGHEGDYRPEKRGFDISLTTVGDTQHSHFDPVMLRNGVEEQKQGYRTDILFDEASQFIEQNKEKPFFCYIPTYAPHSPLVAPNEYIEPYKGKVNEKEATFFAMLACIDHNIGKLMTLLSEWGLEKDTLVILMNDNGATNGVDIWNAEMRGCKGTAWHGANRALSFWRLPGHFKAKTVTELCGHIDVLPTVADITGIELHDSELDGVSLINHLQDHDNESSNERILFSHQGRWPTGEARRHKYAQCSVRYKDYQLVRNDVCDDPDCKGECRIFRKAMTGANAVAYSQRNAQFHYAVTSGNWKLFDIKKDPGEYKDLLQELPHIVHKMKKAYDDWWDSLVEKLEAVS